MENLLHDVAQWAIILGGVGVVATLWYKTRQNIAEEVHLKRDIIDLKKKVRRLRKRDGRIFETLDDIKDMVNTGNTRLTRIETKLKLETANE